MTNINSVENAPALLKKYRFNYKKRLGQNFIFDRSLLKRIVDAAEIKPGDQVVEIGPGAGTLTKELAESGAEVIAIEIDKSLLPVLQEVLKGQNVHIVQGDILKLDLNELIKEYNFREPYKIVANLPYYITTPVIMNLLEKQYNVEQIVIMVQLEVAERLVAEPGGKDYGAITLPVRYYTEPQILFKVSGKMFTPSPAVESAVLSLKKRKKPPVDVYNPDLMFKLIKGAFGQRRKTLLNALSSVTPPLSREEIVGVLETAGINKERRGETLSLAEYAKLANCWSQKVAGRNGENPGQIG